MNIFWFRRDLRIEDNAALFNALKDGKKVLPIFIFDKSILKNLPKEDARVAFISQQLDKLHNQLKEVGSRLAVFYGKPIDIFSQLTIENKVDAVFANHDYEPYAIARDQEIKNYLNQKNITFNTFKDQVIFERNEVTKNDGLPYTVFTPYAKKWKAQLELQPFSTFPSEKLLHQITEHQYPFLGLEEIGFKTSSIKVEDYVISNHWMEEYENIRNFPSQKGTSWISPHLRFGTVSIRKIVSDALLISNQTFLNELIWREFFMQILWHFPHTNYKSFKPKYDAIEWRNNEAEFEQWCQGKTGYPIVDAGMRQLNATGYMHNRVRMVVASFLCKHLLIDWRWGEAYFANKLLDYEQSSNVGNWQWVAGSGVDAAPYFRIFNPTEQAKKFDPKAEYIKHWVLDYQDFSYAKPIVEHTFARQRCLAVYKKAVKVI